MPVQGKLSNPGWKWAESVITFPVFPIIKSICGLLGGQIRILKIRRGRFELFKSWDAIYNICVFVADMYPFRYDKTFVLNELDRVFEISKHEHRFFSEKKLLSKSHLLEMILQGIINSFMPYQWEGVSVHPWFSPVHRIYFVCPFQSKAAIRELVVTAYISFIKVLSGETINEDELCDRMRVVAYKELEFLDGSIIEYPDPLVELQKRFAKAFQLIQKNAEHNQTTL